MKIGPLKNIPTLTWAFGLSPLITASRFFFITADSAAQAAAVLLVGTLVQSPMPKMLAAQKRLERNVRSQLHRKVYKTTPEMRILLATIE